LEGEGPPEPVRLRTTEMAADLGAGHPIRLGSSVSVNIKKNQNTSKLLIYSNLQNLGGRGASRAGAVEDD